LAHDIGSPPLDIPVKKSDWEYFLGKDNNMRQHHIKNVRFDWFWRNEWFFFSVLTMIVLELKADFEFRMQL
jgi:hypothetical protein